MDLTGFNDVMAAYQNIWYIFVGIGLIVRIIMGIFTAKLAGKKGYRGYFFTGFFFNLIGLIYVVGLPLAQDASGFVRRRLQD